VRLAVLGLTLLLLIAAAGGAGGQISAAVQPPQPSVETFPTPHARPDEASEMPGRTPLAEPLVWRLRDIRWTRQIGGEWITLGYGKTLTTTQLFTTGILTLTLNLPPTIVEGQPFAWDFTLRGGGIGNPWDAIIMRQLSDYGWDIHNSSARGWQPFGLALRGNALWGNPRGGWRTELTAIPRFDNGQTTAVYCEQGCTSPPRYPLFRGGNRGNPNLAAAEPQWELVNPAAPLIQGRVYAPGGAGLGDAPLIGVAVALLRDGVVLQETVSQPPDGSYVLAEAPAAANLVIRATLELAATDPPAFQVTYGQRQSAGGPVVYAATQPFSNIGAANPLNRDIIFTDRPDIVTAAAISKGHLDDLGVIYYHTRQAWQLADRLLQPLDFSLPVDVVAFSIEPGVAWRGSSSNDPSAEPDPFIRIQASGGDSLISDGGRPDNREWHEFGHHVMADMLGNLMPRYPRGADNTNHGGYRNVVTTDSWTEGFAEFYSLLTGWQIASRATPWLYRWNTAGGATNLESNFRAMTWTDEEFAVAGLLWDLVDPVDADDASVMTGANGIRTTYADCVALDWRTLWSYFTQSYSGTTTLQAGDLWGSNNNARNLLLLTAPPSDFEISTRVEIAATQNWQQAALLIYADDDNYVRLARVYDNGGQVQLVAEMGGTPLYWATPTGLTALHLKLSRVGATYTGFFSADGVNWAEVGHVAGVSLPGVRAGLAAWGGTGAAAEIAADFDWFCLNGGAPGATPTPTPTVTRTPTASATASPAGTPTQTWQIIYADGFEGGFPAPWQRLGNPGWGRTTCKAAAGSYSVWPAADGAGAVTPCVNNYPNNLNAWLIYGPFSLAGATAAEMTFRRWQRSEEDFDFLHWLASVDGQHFYGVMDSGDTGGWVSETFDLSNVYTLGDLRGRPQVWIAFLFQSDADFSDQGVFLDEVVVRKRP
jgi:hypothetical protein